MKFKTYLTGLILAVTSLHALPEEMEKIMQQEKYKHSTWGVFVKDLDSGEILFEQNSDKLFSPASTTKLFSVEALLHAFGDDYRFKTPVFAKGKIENGTLQGNLILVAKGDLTMGGRSSSNDTISYTKLDHLLANLGPGVSLTKEDPLKGLNDLAMQVAKTIKEINGDVIIDDSLFETIFKRDMILTPIIINDNVIDIVVNPATSQQNATITWRPQVPGYTVKNEVKTVPTGGELEINITSDVAGKNILVQGTIPDSEHNVIRTFSIKDPKSFAQAAFIAALKKQGVKINMQKTDVEGQTLQVAELVSPPLSEYAKLIFKVSHNLGADLIPLLLASKEGKKSYDEGMRLLGDFVINVVKVNPSEFVFIDGAGGNENRLTPQAEVKLLEFVKKQKPAHFKTFYDALPILGVDGNLEDFAKNTAAAGKVRAKPGTGAAYNLAQGKFFLITQGYAGYIEGKNGHLYAYIVIVNNAEMPTFIDVLGFFEDEGILSSIIYEHTGASALYH